MDKRIKPKPKHVLFTWVWYNPVVYFLLIFALPIHIAYYTVAGMVKGISLCWDFYKEVVTKYTLK